MERVKLWRCTFRGKYLAVVGNVLSPALGRDMPDVEAIRAALPHYCRHMLLWPWSEVVSGSTDGSMKGHVDLFRRAKRNDGLYGSVTCEAYFYPETED